MKKIVTILFFALIFLFPLISSVDIEMPTNLSSGQTAIVKISGSFLDPISLDNVKFYRGHVQTYFDYNVGKIGDSYYVYFQTLNKAVNNYSINISGVRYYEGAQILNDPFSKKFSLNSETADFKVNPGIVVTNGNFSIEVQNLNPSTITINLNTETTSGSTLGLFDFLFNNNALSSEPKSFTLSSGQTKDLDVFLEGITETTIRSITLSSSNIEYIIPVYVIMQSSSNTTEENTTTQPEENQTTEENQTIEENQTVSENETTTNETTTQNESTGNFWDIFKRENKTSETVSTPDYEVITDAQGNEILVDKNGDIVEKNVSIKTCEQLKGDLCVVGEEICDGTKVNALNGECCIGTCTQKQTSNNGKIIGWVIIGLIVILLIWFKRKYSKTKRKKFKLPGIDKR